MSVFEWVVTVVLVLAVVAACGVVAGAVGRATRDRIVGSTEMPGEPANRWLPATTPDEEAVRAHLREDWLHFQDDIQSVLGPAYVDSRKHGGQR